jgi:hypothetical protein
MSFLSRIEGKMQIALGVTFIDEVCYFTRGLFRDGNVPAQMEPLQVAQRAFGAVQGATKESYYRADSACHESMLVNRLRDVRRKSGP